MPSPFASSSRNSKPHVLLDSRTNRFIIRCHPSDNALIKPFSEWDRRRGAWVARVTPRIGARLSTLPSGIEVDVVTDTKLLELRSRWETRQRALTDRAPFPRRYKHKVKPYAKQMEALDKLYGLNVGALFMDMGTGKTKVAIDLASAWYIDGRISYVLVFSPLSVRLNWMENLERHSPILHDFYLLGQRNDKGWTTPAPGSLAWLAVGLESMSAGSAGKKLEELLEKVDQSRLLVIVDESHWIKNPKSNRTDRIIELSKESGYRLALTGSPTPQGPLDYYSQLQFLDPDILGSYGYYAFRGKYAIMGGYENKQILGYKDEDKLAQAIAPYVFQVKLEEVTDMPETVFETITVDMTPEQKVLYEQMRKEGIALLESVGLEDKELVTQTILEQYLRLQQITAGFIVNPKPHPTKSEKLVYEPVDILPKTGVLPGIPPKVRALADFIINLPDDRSVIIWHRFDKEAEYISDMLLTLKFLPSQIAYLNGSIPEQKRLEYRQAFQSGERRFMVANAAAGGIGVDMTAGSYMFFMTNDYNYSTRSQAVARMRRSGQTRTTVVYDVVCKGTIDLQVIRALASKKNVAEYLWSLINAGGIDAAF